MPASTIFAAASLLVGATVAATPSPVRGPQPEVDVVFVLDTTGSMSGLIEAAKQKIWTIATAISKGKPSPRIRVGLIGYRDKKDAYVTVRHDLTTDLDEIYEKLTAFRANGGGDTPEHVNRALREAVHEMRWSPNPSALKLVFLVGDAPPHMDYPGDIKYQQTCLEAHKLEIILNTVQCGNVAGTAEIWKEIATCGAGHYMAIAQSGGAVAIATPYDKRMAELSRKLDGTYVAYGSASVRARRVAKLKSRTALALKAAPEAAASRAAYRASKKVAIHKKDLVIDAFGGGVGIGGGSADVGSMHAKHLPEAMRKLSPAKRKKYLKKKAAERERVRKKIAKLSQKRDAFIKQELARNPKADASFSAKVIKAIRKQAATKGIAY